MVVDQMRRLGLAHLIGLPTVVSPNDPRTGLSQFKWLETPDSMNGEEELPVNEE